MLFSTACMERQEPKPRVKSAPQPAAPGEKRPPPRTSEISRADFNRIAVQLDLPIYWIADNNADGKMQPDEVASLLFYPTHPAYVENGALNLAWRNANAEIFMALHEPPIADARRKLVREDLDQGRPSLVASDFTQRPAADKAFVKKMLEVADLIDKLYAVQTGTAVLAAQVASDPRARAHFAATAARSASVPRPRTIRSARPSPARSSRWSASIRITWRWIGAR